MALNDKKYEKFYNTTGSGKDKIENSELAKVEAIWDADRANGCDVYIGHDDFGPIIFQLQQMQDELDALRTEIALNKSKTTFPGIGTSGSTCLAGDTTTISTSQANAITANTKKTGITTAQTKAITANTAKVSFPTCSTNIEESTATITGFAHIYDSKKKANTLKISLQVVSGKGAKANYSTTLTLLQELG